MPPSPVVVSASRRTRAPDEPVSPIHRADYMTPGREEERFTLAGDGLPTGHLAHGSGQLVILADGGPEEMVNTRSTRLFRLGIYVFRVRGVTHHDAAVRAGNFSPGAPVRLLREPENSYDSNAVAIFSERARKPAGYANRQNAARIAKRLDAGEELAAIALRGSRAGAECDAPVILVAAPEVLAHLARNL